MTQMIKIITTKVITINHLPGTKQTFPDKVQKKMLSILKTTVDDHSSASKATLSHTLLAPVRVDQCKLKMTTSPQTATYVSIVYQQSTN